MAVEKTFNGNVYNSDTSFAGYLYVTALLALAGDIMADAGRGLVTTSVTSYALGSGTGTIAMGEAIPFKAGAFIILADSAAPTTNYALVQASADASGTSLSFTEIVVAGSGTLTAWNLSISGPRGATGAGGSNGLNGADGFAPGGTAGSPLDMSGYKLTVDAVDLSYANVGDVTGTTTVTAVPYSRIRLTGDTTVTLTGPAASHGTVNLLELAQDGTGGWTPTFTGYTWIGDEPSWGAMAAAAVGVLGWYETPTGRKRIYVIEEFA